MASSHGARIRRFVKNPYVLMFTGFALLLTGIFEATETVFEEFIGFDIKSYHGVIVFGAVKILDSIASVIEGTEKIECECIEAESEGGKEVSH